MSKRTHALHLMQRPRPAADVAVQRLPASRAFAPASPAVERPRTLPGDVLQKMEGAFGHDFSRVRIHEGGRAPEIGARAFARGENLHFAPGAFRPHSAEGQKVLGHELAHIVQQRERLVRPTARIGRHPLNADAGLESHADRAGEMAARGLTVSALRPNANAGPASAPGDVVQGWFDKPWHVGAAVAGGLGLAYAAYRFLGRRRPPTMRIPMSKAEHYQDLKETVQTAVGNDHPKVRWNDGAQTMETDYDAQQLFEQVPRITLPIANSHPTLPGEREAWEKKFGSEELLARRTREQQTLLARTAEMANDFDYGKVDKARPQSLIDKERGWLKSSATETEGLTRILADHQGVVFGENHGSHENKKYISDHMSTLAKSGVNTLYLEHLRPDHQPHVDEWLTAPESAGMPPELDRFLNTFDAAHNASGAGSVRGILDAAKQHKVRVRAADTLVADDPGNRGDEGLPVRGAAMNQFAMEQVKDDRGRGDGKYVMLVGAAHNNTQRGNDYTRTLNFKGSAPGLSQMLNIPAVTVDEKKDRPRLDEEIRGHR